VPFSGRTSMTIQIFALFFFCLSLSDSPDSLKRRAETMNGHEKLKALLAVTKIYMTRSPDSCMKYGAMAVKVAKELHDKTGEALADKRMGYSWYLKGDYPESIRYYERAFGIYMGNRDFPGAAEISNLCGDSYNQTGNYRKAMDYFMQAIKSCDTLVRNKKNETTVKKLYSILFNNIGLLYFNLDSIHKPMVCFQTALQYARETGDSSRMTASYTNLGMVCRRQKQYKTAAGYYCKALLLARSAGDRYYESKILNNLANLYEERNMIDSAMVFIRKARVITVDLGNKPDLGLVDRNIARYSLIKGQYDSALKYITGALDISRRTGSLHKTYENYRILSEIWEKKGNRELALKYYKDYSELRDSVTGEVTREKIADIQTKYETEKKETENAILRKDNQIKEMVIGRKNTILYVFIGLTILVVIFLIIITRLFRVKSRAYRNLVSQNLKLLGFEKQSEQEILAIPEPVAESTADPGRAYQGLGLKLQKFLIEEKPYLWADVSMDEFCRKLNTNRSYLSKVIHDQYQTNFHDLLCEYRIRVARDMLADKSQGHISVEGIGELAGFKSNSNFHKKFKSMVGLTPNQYRDRAYKKNHLPES
jgi:tetratricopeptide (TPR) repeat protein